MYVVAIARLGTSLEEAADALAARSATTAYEERLKLRAGTPAIVMTTPDAGRAAALVEELERRGHDVIWCDAGAVVASSAMTLLRRFRFDDDALVVVTDLREVALPWRDVSALLRATQRVQVERVETVTSKKFSAVRALATGGLSLSKTTKQEVVTRSEDREPVLYVFRRSDQPPWLLAQHRAQFGGLGDQIVATAAPNFELAVERMRALATSAVFDDRLLARKTSTVGELDLLAHLLAMDLRARQGR